MEPDHYERLARSSPAERAELVLRLIDPSAEARLRLPSADGVTATLDEIDLSRGSLCLRFEAAAAPPWWDAARRGIDLSRADLRGASLRGARLAGANLEGANLAGADLAGADLEGALLDGADLTGAFVEDAVFRGARMRFANLGGAALEGAKLAGADLWGARLSGADLDRTDLHGANLTEADLADSDLRGCDLRDAVLSGANLSGSRLQGSDLQGAALTGANLAGAVLRDAKLQAVSLTGCDVTHAHFADAWLDRTRLLREQLGGAIGEELAGEYELARRGYLALERNFDEIGETDASSWAYRRKRRMQKLAARRRARTAFADRDFGAAAWSSLDYVSHLLTEWVCDYGESIPRVLLSMVALFALFLALYAATGSVVRQEDAAGRREVTRRADDLALYSLTAMISPGNPPENLFPSNNAAQLLTGGQSFLGIFLIGLLGFVAGNRIRR
jgi:uncharacterized protein YjbI with pentapeptide repeats